MKTIIRAAMVGGLLLAGATTPVQATECPGFLSALFGIKPLFTCEQRAAMRAVVQAGAMMQMPPPPPPVVIAPSYQMMPPPPMPMIVPVYPMMPPPPTPIIIVPNGLGHNLAPTIINPGW